MSISSVNKTLSGNISSTPIACRIAAIEAYILKYHNFVGPEYTDNVSATYFSKSLRLRLFDDLNDFELYPIHDSHPRADKIKTHREHLSESITDIMAIMREVIDWYDDVSDTDEDIVDGFTNHVEDADEITPLPKVDHDANRELSIYVWGRKHRTRLHHKVDHNFNAAVLHGKKAGTDWTLDGRSECIRTAVMKCKGFNNFMKVMVETIEKLNCSAIGINCRAGRHRSVTCAFILQMHYYPKTLIRLLEI
jgi:hypothetical protein